MQLELAIHPVSNVRFQPEMALSGTSLHLDQEALRRLVLEDSSFESVEFAVARPGESLRAGPVFDIVEPRAKFPGASPDWPGILGPPQTTGSGTTHVLEGMALTMLLEQSPGESRGATGYILEMSGEPAAVSRYGALNHLIIIPHTKTDLPGHARLKAYRLAQLKIAVQLAQLAFEQPPARREVFTLEDSVERAGLPRAAYVGQIFSRQRKPQQGEQILYGADTDGMLPVALHPNEWLDGAVVTSYHCSIGGAETYFYQNHPVIAELYRRHRQGELNFVGTVATVASANNFDRERNCRFAANLTRWALRADAAILTKFGGGVPHTDLSETARLLELQGIKTVVQVTDLARDHKVESALLFNFPEVNAIVCIGGNDTQWQLPRVERVLAANGGMAEVLAGPFDIQSLNVSGVANQQGASRLRSTIY